MTLRNVITTVATREVPEEYATAVSDILEDTVKAGRPGRVIRETFSKDEIGQKDYLTRLVTYPAPDTGEDVFAVEDADPAAREVEEADTRQEAEDRYEEVVRARDAAVNSSAHPDDVDDVDAWFDYSDVTGVHAKETPEGPNPAAIRGELDGEEDEPFAAWAKAAESVGLDFERVGFDDDGDALVRVSTSYDSIFYGVIGDGETALAVPVAVVKITS